MDKKPVYFPQSKIRTIKEVSKRYLAANDAAVKLLHGRWAKWAANGDKLKSFWGYARIFPKRVVVFTFDGEGYTHNYLDGLNSHDDKLRAQITDPQDLPLLINDKKLKDFVADILSKKLPSIVKRQDLVEEHYLLEALFQHIYTVKRAYLNILRAYIQEKYRDKIYDKKNYGEPLLLILTIGGHTYHFNCDGRGINIMSNIAEEYTVKSKESINTPRGLDRTY